MCVYIAHFFTHTDVRLKLNKLLTALNLRENGGSDRTRTADFLRDRISYKPFNVILRELSFLIQCTKFHELYLFKYCNFNTTKPYLG